MGWLRDARHRARHGHYPEWVGLGGLIACVRCVKGGRRERLRPVILRRPIGVPA